MCSSHHGTSLLCLGQHPTWPASPLRTYRCISRRCIRPCRRTRRRRSWRGWRLFERSASLTRCGRPRRRRRSRKLCDALSQCRMEHRHLPENCYLELQPPLVYHWKSIQRTGVLENKGPSECSRLHACGPGISGKYVSSQTGNLIPPAWHYNTTDLYSVSRPSPTCRWTMSDQTSSEAYDSTCSRQDRIVLWSASVSTIRSWQAYSHMYHKG